MALPTSGPLSLSQIRNEFDGVNPVRMSEYYSGGPYVSDSNVPSSGPLAISDFYGAANAIQAVISSPTTNVDVQSLFTPDEWTSPLAKEVVIDSGVTVGSNSTSSAAVLIPSGYSGDLSLINNGSIEGAGGVGGVGGNALEVSAPVTVNNQGEIYAGGGAGGLGGAGTGGRNCYPGPPVCTQTGGQCNNPCSSCTINSNAGNCGTRRNPLVFRICGQRSNPTVCNPTSAGTGGEGGVGQGFVPQPSPTPGQDSTNSGGGGGSTAGGPGGPGGTWGQPGQPGFNGPGGPGQPGFDGGFYIVNNSLVNWQTLGDVLGRVS